MIERHGCARKQLLSFSAGGKRHKHPVVKALYYELLRRIENKKVTITREHFIDTHPSIILTLLITLDQGDSFKACLDYRIGDAKTSGLAWCGWKIGSSRYAQAVYYVGPVHGMEVDHDKDQTS